MAKKSYLFSFPVWAYLYCMFFFNCTESQNRYNGNWTILEEMYSGRRGANSVEIIQKNDSLFIAFDKDSPILIKIEKDSIAFPGHTKIMGHIDGNNLLHIDSGDSYMVYSKVNDTMVRKINSETSPKLVAILFATEVYKLNFENIPKYTTKDYGKIIITALNNIFTREKKKNIDQVVPKILATSQENGEICYDMKLNLHTVEGEYINVTTKVCLQKKEDLWKVVKISNIYYD